jgi:hypothetical protein
MEGKELPKIQDISFNLFHRNSGNEQNADYVGDVSVFMKDLDDIFLNMPVWIKEEFSKWKISFIYYFINFLNLQVPTYSLTNESLNKENISLKNKEDIYNKLYIENISNDIKTMKYFRGLFNEIDDEKAILFYKSTFLLIFEDVRKNIQEPDNYEWWSYLDKYDLPDIDFITEGVENRLIDTKEVAGIADARINYVLKISTVVFQDIENENIKKLIEEHKEELKTIEKIFQKIQKLKYEFKIAGVNYEIAIKPRGTLEDEILKYQTKINDLDMVYQEKMNEYFNASRD